MAEEKNKTENTPVSVSVEALQTENAQLKEVNATLTSDFEKVKTENERLKTKITELTDVKTDSKTNRTENKKGEVKIKILAPVAGKFLLPYNVGQVVHHPALQADEMVEARYAEYVI